MFFKTHYSCDTNYFQGSRKMITNEFSVQYSFSYPSSQSKYAESPTASTLNPIRIGGSMFSLRYLSITFYKFCDIF